MVAKDACSRRLVSLVDRPCKLHFRQDTVSPFPAFPEIKLRLNFCTESGSQNLAKNLASYSLSICSPPSHSLRTPSTHLYCRSSSSFPRYIRLRRATAEDKQLFRWARRLKSAVPLVATAQSWCIG